MKTILHKAETRGHADFGWLNAHHSFSFGRYYHPERVNFGVLRVLNDDIVQGGKGFGKHPHDNMEIVTIPLTGSLEHRDSTGGHGVINPGEVQLMSAGTGIEHSEFNASATEPVNLLQIWVFPSERNIEPGYQQKAFDPKERINKLIPVVSPVKNNGALHIHQDAWFLRGTLTKDTEITHSLKSEQHGIYLFVIEGAVSVNGEIVNQRDAIGISEATQITIHAMQDAEILVIEVPMQVD